ncbi:hypothetical protein [Adlercreutzia muris]|nr:hypothetical protein [Adlercreutzia muris]MCR2027703.1 hypothetical protein [Adlercreutzia muris]
MVDFSVLASCAFTALMGFIGSWVAFSNRLTRVETKIDCLSDRVEKHNGVIERTYKVESDLKTSFRRYDEMRGDLHEMREKIDERMKHD